METIAIKLDSRKLRNPDLDIISELPVRIEELTEEKVYDDGYDYLNDDVIVVFLAADSAEKRCPEIIELLKKEKFSGNDLSKSAEIYISEQEAADFGDCRKVYPM